MTNLLQVFRRKVSEVRIRQKRPPKSGIARAARTPSARFPDRSNFASRNYPPGYYSDRRIAVVKTTPTGSKLHAGFC